MGPLDGILHIKRMSSSSPSHAIVGCSFCPCGALLQKASRAWLNSSWACWGGVNCLWRRESNGRSEAPTGPFTPSSRGHWVSAWSVGGSHMDLITIPGSIIEAEYLQWLLVPLLHILRRSHAVSSLERSILWIQNMAKLNANMSLLCNTQRAVLSPMSEYSIYFHYCPCRHLFPHKYGLWSVVY